MTQQSIHDGARAWGVHGDLTDGTSPRMFEDATASTGLGFTVPGLISNQIAVAGINATDLVINLNNSVGGGLATGGLTCYCEGEQITYSQIVAGVMTVTTRGSGGTTAAAHALGAVITQHPPLPAGHNRWLKQTPANATLLRYDGDTTVLPIAVSGGMFAAVVRNLWFSGTPTASVNQFLGAIGLSSGSATQFQRWLRLRTDLKVDMIDSTVPPLIYDTSVTTLPRNTLISVAITVETDRAGFIRYRVYYSTDDGATFTQLTWNTAGTAASVTATTLSIGPPDRAWVGNELAGRVVTMGGSTGTILSNTLNVITIDAWSPGLPAAGAFTLNTVDYVDSNSDKDGTLQGFTVGVGAPTADPALDNGISTYFSEIGVIHSSEYLGAYPTGFTVGKFAADANSADANFLEWGPAFGTDHFANVNDELYASGLYVQDSVSNQQEVLGYEASTTTKIPAANTPLVLKSWANLRSSASLPDATNLKHLVLDNGTYYSYASHDTVVAGNLASAVSLRTMPGGGGRWSTARIDAVLAGLDKVGDNALNYRARQMWVTVASISNPASIYTLAIPTRNIRRHLQAR